MNDRRICRIIHWIFPLIILIAFSLFAVALAFSVGVGLGDDAYHAVIAKNLAHGLGYTSTIQEARTDFIALKFDPRVGVGPTIIFSASLIIKLFGNTYWAPGLANVISWTLLCGAIGMLIRKYRSGMELSLATLSFFYLGFALMTFHYWHWYALLGEVPAAFLVILSVLLFFHDSTRLCRFLTGIAVSLAVQAKLLTMLAFVAFLLVVAVFQVSNRSKNEPERQEKILENSIYLLIGAAIPLLAFETWKLFALGPSGYVSHWGSYLSFIRDKGMDQHQALCLLSLCKRRAAILYEGFGISLQSVLFMLMLAGLLVGKDNDLSKNCFIVI